MRLALPAAFLALPGCALLQPVPPAVQQAHAQEAVAAKLLHDSYAAVIEHVSEPQAKLILALDEAEKWQAYVRLHDATARGLGAPPVLDATAQANLVDLAKSILSKK